MAGRIPEETLAEIRARVSIVEVVSAYVALHKAGRSYLGLCPFHSEQTPSFNVNEEGGFFHCFGCGAGGNIFTFLSRIEGMSFPEAVRRLAATAGVSLPQTAKDPQVQEWARLYRLNELAATYFQRCLWGNVGTEARRYLLERGLTPDIAKQFHLGFAPAWSAGLVRFLGAQHADLERAASLGLVGKGGGERYYDKFRYRLMFPITDVVGRLVGFGGRLLPSTQDSSPAGRQPRILPKYLNSPDSVLYKKSSLLYGLSQAKEAIQRCGRVLLVEGYVDLLAVVQHGHGETVAVSGTALTADQLKLLRRFTQEVYIFFDGDEAGRRAATRAFPLCLEAELRGRAVFLPSGDDPDSFARVHGQRGLDRLIDQAEPLEDFYLTQYMPPPGASAFQRAQAAKQAVAVLGPMTDILMRSAFLTQIAQRFGVNEDELRRMTTPPELPRMQPATRTEHHESSRVHWTAETELIQLMLVSRRATLRVAEEGVVPAFQEWGELATEIIAAWQQAGRIDFGAFLNRLPKVLADRVMRAYPCGSSEELEPEDERLLLDCIARIRAAQRRFKREQLQREIREAEQRGDEAGLRLRLQRLQAWDEDR